MKLYLASDHAGFDMKNAVLAYLKALKYEVFDCGAIEFDQNDDYPDFIKHVAEKVAEDNTAFGIIFGKSGAGEAICANRYKNIRAIVGFNKRSIQLGREHNNANVLSLGTEFIDTETAKQYIEIFLNTKFSGDERHVRRINKIDEF